MHSSTAAVVVCVLAVGAGMGFPASGQACTAFSAQTPEGRVVAKSFDWVTGEGWLVLNERGRTRSLLFPAGSPQSSWTSRYASLSLTTVGPGFPISGMNEKGLAIEALVDFSRRPTSTPEPGLLSGLELVQVGLDAFASVAELADYAQKLQFSQLGIALHFLVCDATGECAVIEQRRDGTQVTRQLPVQALANRPYAKDLDDTQPSGLAAWLGLAGPSRGSSAYRFGTVARAIAAGAPRERDALDLLEQVAMRRLTQWQLVWNLERRTLLLRQRETGLGTASFALTELTRRCTGTPRVRPLGRQSRGGFAPWSEHDAAKAQESVLLQLGSSGEEARALASLVVNAIGSSECRSAQ